MLLILDRLLPPSQGGGREETSGLAWSNLNMLWPAFEAFVYWDFMLLKVIECLASNKELGIRDMSSSDSDSSVENEFCSPVGKDVFSLFLEWLLVGNR